MEELLQGKNIKKDEDLSMNNKCKILLVTHKPCKIPESKYIVPIHAGRAVALEKSKDGSINQEDLDWLIENTIGDNTGDNISAKNTNYCELTAQYWVWKNYKCDFVGFSHYRRLFDIGNEYSNEEYAENINFNKLTYRVLNNIIENYDIILPPVYNVHPVGLPRNIMTNYDFYKREHIISDLDSLIEILKEDYPNYVESAMEYLYSTKTVFFNMFIMKWDIFDNYCKWLFDILYKLEKRISISEDTYQKRVFGFLAERLLNIYVLNLIKNNPQIKIYHCDVINVIPEPLNFEKKNIVLGKCEYLQTSIKNNTNDFIDIIFSTDNKYAPHCAAAIASILLNCKSNVNFRFHIFDGNISIKNKSKLNNLKKIRNFEINFYNMKKYNFSEFALNRSYISEATYYRLMMLDVLPKNLEKVIYLDCDIIVEQDIKEFWDSNITGFYAGVVEDEGSVLQIRRMNLPLKNNYFNAGILLLNLNELRKINFKEKCFEYYQKNKSIITLQDQDILNGVLNGKCKFLPLKWNANARIYLGNSLERKYSINDEIEAGYNPAIIHYTDIQKPWKIICNHPLKNEYWKYRQMTPFKYNYVKLWFKNLIDNICKFQITPKIKALYVFNIPVYKKEIGRVKSLKILGIKIFKRTKIGKKKTIYIMGVKL